VLNLAAHLAITIFTALIRNHVVSDFCSASRKIYLTQVCCLIALIYFCFNIRISEGGMYSCKGW